MILEDGLIGESFARLLFLGCLELTIPLLLTSSIWEGDRTALEMMRKLARCLEHYVIVQPVTSASEVCHGHISNLSEICAKLCTPF